MFEKRKAIISATVRFDMVTVYRADSSDWEDKALACVRQLMWLHELEDLNLDAISIEWLTDAEEI